MNTAEKTRNSSSQIIFLVGIGMGSVPSMTEEAAEAVRSADCLIGAGRMLETAQKIANPACTLQEYDTAKICAFIREHREFEKIAVLFSGDTGFLSGAKKLAAALGQIKEESAADSFRKSESESVADPSSKSEAAAVSDSSPKPEEGSADESLAKSGTGGESTSEGSPAVFRREIRIIAGVSSVAYLAAKLGIPWEDAKIVSLHGREASFIQTIRRNKKTFILLGGRKAGELFYRRMLEYDMQGIRLSVGENLSYPDERVREGTIRDFSAEDFAGLCIVLAQNPHPDLRASCHVPDEAFIRGDVPMTKAAVRAVSLAQLQLKKESVLYDVGAGTGSVSVEAARSDDCIHVYAIEKNPNAVELLKTNRKKFGADGIHIVEGTAPQALEVLEVPTHVFIGGSAGSLRAILETVLRKNPAVRIVINAATLETLGEVTKAMKDGLLKNAQVTQIAAAQSACRGNYHMMRAQNPVYVISAGASETVRV